MKKAFLIVLCYILLNCICIADAVENDKKTVNTNQLKLTAAPLAWRICSLDDDCISIKVGCWFWVIANKKYSKEVVENIGSRACLSSTNAGPQPVTACIDNVCVEKEK